MEEININVETAEQDIVITVNGNAIAKIAELDYVSMVNGKVIAKIVGLDYVSTEIQKRIAADVELGFVNMGNQIRDVKIAADLVYVPITKERIAVKYAIR